MINNFEYGHVDELIRGCLADYYGIKDAQILTVSSGMNNITRVIKCGVHTFNIRIYCNHQDKQKVSFEHEILFQLLASTIPLQFPVPVKTLFDSTIAQLADGRLVALYTYIEGSQEKSDELYGSLIEATAHLSLGLAQIKLEEQGEYSPYYDLASNYPQFTNKHFVEWCEQHQLDDGIYQKLNKLNETRAELEAKRKLFKSLPHQLIHGDINFSNSVCKNNKIIGLLDFEFVTYDIRAMELAVVLIELFKQGKQNVSELLNMYLALYTSIHPLTDAELKLLPDLVKLRAIDVAFHFMTRFNTGIDELAVLLKIVRESYGVIQELNNL